MYHAIPKNPKWSDFDKRKCVNFYLRTINNYQFQK